ncbi:MAG: PAS domain-containing sensor histidine kinase, partial [Chitinophagaceae bacterium]
VADNILLAQSKSDARHIENNEWKKYIGEVSYDVMWDWDIATGEIYTGDSIEEVFGYTVQNNIVSFTDFAGCLLPEEKDKVEKKLWKTLASGDKSWNDTFSFKRHDGSVASTISRASIVRDVRGKAIRLIGATQDVSRVQELEKKLTRQNKLQEEDSKTFLQFTKLSFDIIWDWNLKTNEVFRGEGFEELLGYPVKNYKDNLSDLTDHLHPDDKEVVLIGLQQAIASSTTPWEHAFRIIRPDGTIAKVMDRVSILRDPEGKAYRLIGVMRDLSRQKELEEMLDHEIAAKWTLLTENVEMAKLAIQTTDNMLIHQAFDNSIQANVISILDSGKIISANSAACRLLGYSKKELLTKSRNDVFDVNQPGFKEMLDQRKAEGHSTAFLTAKRKSGKSFPCEITSAIFMDKDGIEKAITTIADMSQSILKQKEIDSKKEKTITDNIILAQAKSDIREAENNERHFLAVKFSSDLLWEWNLITGEISVGNNIEGLFGYALKNKKSNVTDWVNKVHAEDVEALDKSLHNAIVSTANQWEHSFRFIRADDSIVQVVGRASIIRLSNGKAHRMIGALQDVSKQTVMEERLEQEIKLKENQIEEATREAKETERSEIGRELHDNVNQLLGVSRLYLDMAKQGGENSAMYLNQSSEYTLTAIEEIRKLTRGLTTDTIKNLGLCEAIDTVVRDTMEVNPVKISFEGRSFIEQSVNDKFKLNFFRIVQEQVNNILKHAKATEVVINLTQNEKTIMLTIADNGVGFDTSKKRKGIGVENIRRRALSYNGSAGFVSQPGQGCVLTVTFPVTDILLKKS